MGKDAQFDGETMVEVWRSPAPPPPPSLVSPDAASLMLEQSSDTLSSPTSVLADNTNNKVEWEGVGGLESLQLQALKNVASQGVLWKHPTEAKSLVFTLHHGGDVEADGNCLFTASQRAMRLLESPLEVRLRTVKRFLIEFEACIMDQQIINDMISHLYTPDVTTGWGVHVVQDVKLLARKADREALDASIEELVQVGVSRDSAAESIMKDHCIPVADGESWAKYMSLSGSYNDEYDIITLQYTEEGLLGVDENREGRAAAFGDDIAIQCLASEYEREIFVVLDVSCLIWFPRNHESMLLLVGAPGPGTWDRCYGRQQQLFVFSSSSAQPTSSSSPSTCLPVHEGNRLVQCRCRPL